MTHKAKAPAEVLQDQGRGEKASLDTDEATARRAKRKLGNVWLERGRYLFKSGPNGSPIFDTWKRIGLPKRGRA